MSEAKLTPEGLLNWVAAFSASGAQILRDLIANQREQPEPVAPKQWPDAAGVWAKRLDSGEWYVAHFSRLNGDYVGEGCNKAGLRVRLYKDNPNWTGGWLPCTVTPHPAREPERVEPRPLMLYGQPKHPDQATWLARFGDHWRSIGCATAYRSIDIIEVNEAATDCPEAVALWRGEGGGQ